MDQSIWISNKTHLKIHDSNFELMRCSFRRGFGGASSHIWSLESMLRTRMNTIRRLFCLRPPNEIMFNTNRPTCSVADKTGAPAAPATYTLTPDSTGVVHNEELCLPSHWKDA